MNVEKIAAGIYWLEIPEADLRILCGCPADSVKHLTYSGKIKLTTQGNATFETGPNAILLSDEWMQNGLFANMAEFPVLQMFYKQGQIIPNHPNNTGLRPILIGSRQQVHSQLQYIYLGNYGLTTAEELMECGAKLDEALDMMAMKMHFAFGKIMRPEELLATCVVEGDGWFDIRNGVKVRRTGQSQYLVSYNGEEQALDLRLAADESYPPPYTLPEIALPRDRFCVWHTGEGDGWDHLRPCMGSILMIHGAPYLIDAGPNIHYTLEVLGVDLSEVAGIFHTHSHDDHFAGLPSLMRAGHRLKYFATPLVRRSAFRKLSALLDCELEEAESYFEFHDLPFDDWSSIAPGVEVLPAFSPHPVETNIFYFRHTHGETQESFAHLADIISFGILDKMRGEQNKHPVSQAFYEKVKANYLRPSNVKKIDAGGGLIHGEVVDFQDDETEKLILAHTSGTFSAEQLQRATTASFGNCDLQYAGGERSITERLVRWLLQRLPALDPQTTQELLMGAELRSIPSGATLQAAGSRPEELLLLATGRVRYVTDQRTIQLPVGTMLGETAALCEEPIAQDIVAHSPVQVLPIDVKAYRALLQNAEALEDRRQLLPQQDALRNTTLFCELIDDLKLYDILREAQSQALSAGESLAIPAERLGLLQSGTVQLSASAIEISAGDVCGEEFVLQHSRPESLEVSSEGAMLWIPAELLRDIPIVRWHLFETYRRREAVRAI
jgi:hemerythrin